MWMWYVYFLSLFHIHYPLHSTLATFIASQNTDVQSTSSTSKVTQMPPITTTRFILRCRDVSRIQGEGGVRASLINIYLSVCENHEKNTLHSNVFGLLDLEPTCHFQLKYLTAHHSTHL
jgi:hypothetical protein